MTRKTLCLLLAVLLIVTAAGCAERTDGKKIELPDPSGTGEPTAPVSGDLPEESGMPSEAEEQEPEAPVSQNEAEPESDLTEAVFEQNYISIRMWIPEDWEYTFRLDLSEAGIRFWPAGNPDAYAELFYGGLGVCGTGLEQVPDTFSGYPVSIGYYDGRKDWDFVHYQDAPGDYWAWNQGLTGDDAEEALRILSGAKVGEGALLRSEAVQIAEASAPEGYVNRYMPSMDPVTGIWTIPLGKDDSRMDVSVSPDGTVLESSDID